MERTIDLSGHEPRGNENRPAASQRIAMRTRELDAIQALGRVAASATDVAALFDAVADLLSRWIPIDCVAVVHQLDGAPAARFYPGCPHAAGYLEKMMGHGCRLMGWADDPGLVWEVKPLDDYDPGLPERSGWSEANVIVLPVLGGRASRAYVLVHPCGGVDESQVRLVFAAGSQLSMHVERILEARAAETERFGAILETMPQAVCLTDPMLAMRQTNRAARALLERTGLHSLLLLVETLGLADRVDEVLQGRLPQLTIEAPLRGAGLFNVTVSRFDPDAAGARGLIFVLTDVTEQRRLQEQLAQSEKMSSLGQLISGVAHELNNPLGTIVGSSQLVRRLARDEPKLTARLEILEQEAGRCQRIVGNLLSFARKRGPRATSLSLNEVARSVVSLVAYAAKTDGVALNAELDPELPAVHGDADQLRQVLLNLLTNARQAIRSGGGSALEVRTEVTAPDWVRLEVRDDGPGIPDEDRERIFEPFYTTKDEGEGTGLGLSIVREIVEKHGGRLSALPNPIRGAVLRIDLPCRPPRESDAPLTAVSAPDLQGAEAVAAPLAEAVAEPVPTPESRSAARVLVVDDEQPFARLICDALEEDGVRAEAAFDGVSGLGRMRAESFDLVLVDARMPGTGAVDLFRKVRDEIPAYRDRLLVMSGDIVDGDVEEFCSREGLAWLPKPFDLSSLRERVEQMIEGRRSREG